MVIVGFAVARRGGVAVPPKQCGRARSSKLAGQASAGSICSGGHPGTARYIFLSLGPADDKGFHRHGIGRFRRGCRWRLRRFHKGLSRRPLNELPVLTKGELMEHFDEVSTDPSIRLGEVQEFLKTMQPGQASALSAQSMLPITSRTAISHSGN